MSNAIIAFSASIELIKVIDNQRGEIPRSKFLTKLLESALTSQNNINSRKKKMLVDNSSVAGEQQASFVKE